MEGCAIIGGGISGLTLALSLHEAGVACRIFEAAPAFKRLGVGINLQPYGVRELSKLGLFPALRSHSVEPCEMNYYNRFGQLVFSEPRGRAAGYESPQLSLHRGDLHQVLIDAVHERLGPDALVTNHQCAAVEQDDTGATIHFVDAATQQPLPPIRAGAVIGCDGFHSAIRRQLYPDEGPPSYQGINMWRGVTRWKPFLSGASAAQAGWLEVGKILMFPLTGVGDDGLQVINWVAEIQSLRNVMLDWNLQGKLSDFFPTFTGWHFPWLDISAMIQAHEVLLECPMVDRDPLPHWTMGRITLVGDAAHPMYPRGGNGAGQSILDARALARCLGASPDAVGALKAYESERLSAANGVVLRVRNAPPDLMLKLVHERSGDRPFKSIDELISQEERITIIEDYKRVAGYDKVVARPLSERDPQGSFSG
jgi:2-polyprenyl-6-methoxyphenol hydroxylase-like FAD-dependent oxidoreductase